MKLLCVNDGKIHIRLNEIQIITYSKKGLIAGKIYETKGEPFLNEEGIMAYYIDGIGVTLAQRFTKALDSASVSIEKKYTKEDLEKAISEENYELATEIQKQI